MGGYSGHARLPHRACGFHHFNTQEETQAFARLNADFESRRDLILAKYAARKGVGCGG